MMSLRAANLNEALRLAAAGIPIFPARIRKEEASNRWLKSPCIADWQNKATTDTDILRGWWEAFADAVPAIPTGKAGLVVIDLDRHQADVDGAVNFDKLTEGHTLPDMPIVHTAGDGLHLYFRQPENAERLGNRRGSLPPGIDVRGDGGFVIAPGAVRADEKIYLPAPDKPDLAEAFQKGGVPQIPEFIAKIISQKPPLAAEAKSMPADKRTIAGHRQANCKRHDLPTSPSWSG